MHMNIKKCGFLTSYLMVLCVSSLMAQTNWEELPPIPDKEGFAGLFTGVSHDVLICAGGANFPNKRPWEGGVKKWYDHIYLLDDENGDWKLAEERLPFSRAYGISVSYNDRVILVGGSDSKAHYEEVIALEYDDGKAIIHNSLPSLPEPLATMCGTEVDGVIYVAGGSQAPGGMGSDRFYMLDLKLPDDELEWIEGPKWPGPSRIQAVAASHDGSFYLFSGFNLKQGLDGVIDRMPLRDAYRYDPGDEKPSKGTWTKLPDMPRATAAAPSPAFRVGMAHLVISGGLDKETIRFTDQASHPGFKETVIAYNVHSNEWVTMDDMPVGSSRVTAPTVFWKNRWVVPNGEIGPGRRSPKVYAFNSTIDFGWQNWATLVIYLCLMLLIGLYYSKKNDSTSDYFVAGGRIPWWAAGLSIYGTQLSAITFMAIPAIVYATDWRLALGSLMIFGIVPIIVRFYLPVYRRANITTAYEYLERRFNVHVRIIGSSTFVLLQLARMGIVLYLPSVAISSVTGIDITTCILVMGVVSTFYTVLGGIEAVIWTDVLQVVVLLGGAIGCIVVAVSSIDGGINEVIRIGMDYDKFKMFDWRWDYTELVMWVAVLGFFFLNLISYTSDQVVIQRYLTVKDEKSAALSLWTNGIIVLPAIFVFFGLGTTLFVYYLTHPAEVSSANPDEILPYFIVAKLPLGLAGLVISGIFAASMSSLDSSMNSISTVYVVDFHKRIWPGLSDSKYLKMARWLTVITGAFGTMVALFIASSDVGFIFDFFQTTLGIIGGSLAGVFVLAIFTKQTHAKGAIAGVVAGAVLTLLVKYLTEINGYLYGAIGVVSCVVVGWLVSRVLPSETKSPK